MGEADKPVYEDLVAQFIAPARAAVGDAGWRRAEAAGHMLMPEDVYDLVLGDEILAPGAGGSDKAG